MSGTWEDVLSLVAQLLLMVLLSPLLSWCLTSLPRLIEGMSVVPLRIVYCHFCTYAVQHVRQGMVAQEGLCMAAVLVVLLVLPGVSWRGGGGLLAGMMADPLLIGGLLVMAGLCLGMFFTPGELAGLAAVLCLTESFLALTASGVNVFLGAVARLSPDAGVIGTGACCALALILLSPIPDEQRFGMAWWQPRRGSRMVCDRQYVPLMLVQAAWLLFLGNLLLPGFVGAEGVFGLIGLFFRLALTLVAVVAVRLLGVAGQPRLIALLMGLALLLALAGRFAT